MTGQRLATPPGANVILAEQDRRRPVGGDAHAWPLTILAAYLVVTLVPAVLAAIRDGRIAVAATHGAALAFVWWRRSARAASDNSFARVLDDGLPLLAVPF